MKDKILKVLKHESFIYLISNIIYSFSTYVVVLSIPYMLDKISMAHFSSALNVIMLMIFVFEFGLTVSFLRFRQLYAISDTINAFFQTAVFLLMLLFAYTFFGNLIEPVLHIKEIDLREDFIYFSAMALLSWVFIKSYFLAKSNVKSIFLNAFAILILRVVFLIYIFLFSIKSLEEIVLLLFIVPFLYVFFRNFFENIRNLSPLFDIIRGKIKLSLYANRVKKYVTYSFLSYVIGALFIYTSRYLILYLTDKKEYSILAELGYAMSFLGLILIFITSIRTYFISKFNISEIENISNYINKIKSYRVYYFPFCVIFSFLVAAVVWLIKPSYLTYQSAIFVFILIFSNMVISYYSLFTLLSKTFNYNILELKLNIIRLILVVISVRLFFDINPIFGFALINFWIVFVEFIFARLVLNRVKRKEAAYGTLKNN